MERSQKSMSAAKEKLLTDFYHASQFQKREFPKPRAQLWIFACLSTARTNFQRKSFRHHAGNFLPAITCLAGDMSQTKFIQIPRQFRLAEARSPIFLLINQFDCWISLQGSRREQTIEAKSWATNCFISNIFERFSNRDCTLGLKQQTRNGRKLSALRIYESTFVAALFASIFFPRQSISAMNELNKL